MTVAMVTVVVVAIVMPPVRPIIIPIPIIWIAAVVI
jgi:hypothetical protein